MIRELKQYASMARQTGRFLRTPPIADARADLLEKRGNRDAIFLEHARKLIFDVPSNPFHEMFHIAGCDYGTLAEEARRDGLERVLQKLYEAGVYLSHDEFKGKREIVRAGRHIRGGPESFSNPLILGGVVGSSSGSRSRGTPVRRNLDWQLYREGLDRFLFPALGLERHTVVQLKAIMPASYGLRRALTASRMNQPQGAWFTLGGTVRNSAHYRVLTKLLILSARWNGATVPSPRYLPHNDFRGVARYLAELKRQGRDRILDTMVSQGVRVAAAAREHRLDIAGTVFLVAGEALTDAKRAVIEEAGCTALPCYLVSEIGFVGMACREMNKDNCVHMMDAHYAVISRRRKAPLCDLELDSLLFTTLASFLPFVLINAEMDDSGEIGPAPCDCPLSRLGYRRQIRNIFSYGKLTGQGTTLLSGDLLRILERTLPARFGGSPTDYQLVEIEGGSQTAIELRVHPRLNTAPAEEIKGFFLGEIKQMWGGALTGREWTQTEGFRVVHGEPYMTRSGKVLPLHLLGFGGRI
jgi:hypothetical protein